MEEHETNHAPRRRFDQQFKEDAVRLATDGTRPLAQVARELGIAPNLLRRWRDQLSEPSSTSLQVKGKTPEEVEIERLKKKLAQVEEEREILKKTMAVFSLGRP